MKHLTYFAALIGFAFCPAAPAAEDDYAKAQVEKIEAFLKSVEANKEIDDETREKVNLIVNTLKDEPAFMDYAITEALQVMNPTFKEALDAWDAYEEDKAIKMFSDLAAAKDPYIQSAGSYSLARALMSSEDFEGALALMEKLSAGEMAPFSLQSAEALFYEGYCHSRMLQREEAVEDLRSFIDKAAGTPAMSATVRTQAQLALDFLQTFEEGSLGDVAEHMDYSRRRLDFSDPGEQTQEKQDKIIAMLDDLIKKAEEQESSASSSQSEGEKPESAGGSPSPGSPSPSQGSSKGESGGGSNQAANKEHRVLGTVQQTPWDMLRDRKRIEEVFEGMKGEVPPRYRDLVEQYHRDLYDGDEE